MDSIRSFSLFAFCVILLLGLVRNSYSQTHDHLLLSEAVLTPTLGEFIEIANPTGSTVNLSNYYLSDDADYALLPGNFGAGPAPSIAASDFIVQFPPGSLIPPQGVIVVAFDGAGFETTFGFKADFEIHGTDAGTPDMAATIVGSTAGLTNTGENAVLFFWDGASDLVVDVDMVILGTPSAANSIGDKTGVAVDGPDADTTPSTYLPDAVTMPQQISAPGLGVSTKRIAVEGTNEIGSGGNGMTGDDETTEDILVTWDQIYTAPDPGGADAPLPVELASFTAAAGDGKVTLRWATQSEVNNERFEIMRSEAKEGQYGQVGERPGQFNSNQLTYYSFEDNFVANGTTYWYKLVDVDVNGVRTEHGPISATPQASGTEITTIDSDVPRSYQLYPAYPNPFNPSTNLKFDVPSTSRGLAEVTVEVYNTLGQRVRSLFSGTVEAGTYALAWNGATDSGLTVPGGVYFAVMKSGFYKNTVKMTLVK